MANQSFKKSAKSEKQGLSAEGLAKWTNWTKGRRENASSDITGVEAVLIGKFVQTAVSNEMAVMFSYWKASNSLAVKVYGAGDPVTVASTDNVDFASELQAFIDAWE